MKNKLLTYLLLVLVIVVWGLIFVRLFGSKNEEQKIQKGNMIKNSIDSSILNTKYTLRFNYADPFLGQKNSISQVRKPKKFIEVKDQPKPEPIEVQYLGMISNKKQKSVLALIRLNGQEYYLSLGETMNGLELIKCDEIEIVLKKGNKKYTVSK